MRGDIMEHPFINSKNLEDNTLEELQEAITDLHKKLTFAHGMGNQPMIQQLQMAIESHKTVYTKKMDKLFEKQKVNSQINVEKNGN